MLDGDRLPHILYCNDEADILVLDVPASLSQAQAAVLLPCSTRPPDHPYLTPEPKGPKRDALLAAIPHAEQEYHLGVQRLVHRALTVLHKQWHEPRRWCHPRVVGDGGQQPSAQFDCLSHEAEPHPRAVTPPLVLSAYGDNACCCTSTFADTVVHNPHTIVTDVVLSHGGRFIIPPRSTFLCASVEHGVTAFEAAVRCLLSRRLFDLILLDPPWSNRSARRSRVYRTVADQHVDPFDELLPTVNAYLSEHGYMAVWVTNKAAIRSQVLSACTAQGLVLVEEWIWMKTTTKGHPITPLDGMWRKPYEILLLFHRTTAILPLVRRVCVAVPDLHSRKPSFKSVFERFLPKDYNALEVFARCLTAGWWSWGDEVLLFQHESKWRQPVRNVTNDDDEHTQDRTSSRALVEDL